MAPTKTTKQTLIPIGSFVKNPTRKLTKKHEKLSKKNEEDSKPKPIKMSGWLKKELAQKKKQQEEREKFVQEWRDWLEDKRITANLDPSQLYDAHGRAPKLDQDENDVFLSSDDDEEDEDEELFTGNELMEHDG